MAASHKSLTCQGLSLILDSQAAPRVRPLQQNERGTSGRLEQRATERTVLRNRSGCQDLDSSQPQN